MTIKMLENKIKELKKMEKRIKLMNQFKKLVQEMNRLDGCSDLQEILQHKPAFSDELYYEIEEVLEKLINHKAVMEKSI